MPLVFRIVKSTGLQTIKSTRLQLIKYYPTSGSSNAASLQDRQIHWPSDYQIHQTPVDQIQPGFTTIKSTRLQDHQMPLVFTDIKSPSPQIPNTTRLKSIKSIRFWNYQILPPFRVIKYYPSHFTPGTVLTNDKLPTFNFRNIFAFAHWTFAHFTQHPHPPLPSHF
jgi:hypothetical protein